ncbi:MAG: PKD domain-containing protein [Litorilinea sp.]
MLASRHLSPAITLRLLLLGVGLWLGSYLPSPTDLRAATHVIYVDANREGGDGDGRAWEHALPDLQAALALAQPGDEIWVAAGVYRPVTDVPAATGEERGATFQLRNEVAIYGGFVGTESSRAARDWQAHVTVLSGDIDQNDTITLQGFSVHPDHILGENSYHVVTSSGVDASARLDGFTITGGAANEAGAPHDRGGGLLNVQGDPTLANLYIVGNRATTGGGGIYNTGSLTLTNSILRANQAAKGGAFMSIDLLSTPRLVNVLFSGNFATTSGGALYISNSGAQIINATISGNRAAVAGGALYSGGITGPLIHNSILWHNHAPSSVALHIGGSNQPALHHSLIEGCKPGGSWQSACGLNGGGNLTDGDPQFIAAPNPAHAPTAQDAETGDLRLLITAPGVEAGDSGAAQNVSTDLDGGPRLYGANIDLGAYEAPGYRAQSYSKGQGSIILTPDAPLYAPETVVQVAAESDAGWVFTGWSGDLHGSITPQNLTLNAPRAITATFANLPPHAHAGAPQTITVDATGNRTVTLDGSGSFDADPDQTLSYGWVQTGGTPIALQAAQTAAPQFTAPSTPANLSFTLVVTDNFGAISMPATTTVTVVDVPISGLVAIATSPTTLGQTTAFSATIDAGSNVTYSWAFGDGNTGDGNTGSGAHPSHIYTQTGVYTARVTATNGTNQQIATAGVLVTNLAPTAHAGADQTVAVNAPVVLDGTASHDPDGHLPLVYAWTQSAGPSVILHPSGNGMTTFSAPPTPATLTFTLVVTDAGGASGTPHSVNITVQDIALTGLHVEHSGPTTLGASTAFTATLDSGSNALYHWDFDDGNTGSGAHPSHIYTQTGVYTAHVTAINGTNQQIASAVVPVANLAPTAHAGADQTVVGGAQVTLNGHSSTDADGHLPLSFAWLQTAGPAVTLHTATAVTVTFIAPEATPETTMLRFQLTVQDLFGATSVPATTTVTVAAAIPPAPDPGDPDDPVEPDNPVDPHDPDDPTDPDTPDDPDDPDNPDMPNDPRPGVIRTQPTINTVNLALRTEPDAPVNVQVNTDLMPATAMQESLCTTDPAHGAIAPADFATGITFVIMAISAMDDRNCRLHFTLTSQDPAYDGLSVSPLIVTLEGNPEPRHPVYLPHATRE